MKRKFLVAAALLAAYLCVPGVIMAQASEDEQTIQDLFQSQAVYTQAKGEAQVTLISQFSKSKSRKSFETPIAFEYGLTNQWQMSLEWSASNRVTEHGETHRGAGDLQLGTKYSWMNIGGSNFHAAAGFDLGLPTGNVEKGLGEGEFNYEPYVVVAKEFPKLSRLQLFSHFGVTVAQPTDDHIAVSKGIVWNNGFFVAHRQARFTAELNWEKASGENSLYVTPGLIWVLPRKMEVGFGVPVGASRDADKFRTIVTFTYEFGGAKKPE